MHGATGRCILCPIQNSCLSPMNSAYSLFKRPAPTKGQPFRKSDKAMTGVYVAHNHYSANIPQEINLAAFPRRINVDRVSIIVMWRAVYATKLMFYGLARTIVRVPLSIVIHRFESCHDSNADSYNRCFRYLDCFGGVKGSRIRPHPLSWMQVSGTFKAVYLSSRVDRSQLRMPEGSNLMLHQNQALTTPVNLVGGAVTCEPYLPLVGLKPSCKGGSYA